jgi:hypothetical protein
VLFDDGDEQAQLLEQKLEESGLLGAHALQEGRHDLRQERNALEPERLEDEHHRLYHRRVVLLRGAEEEQKDQHATRHIVCVRVVWPQVRCVT